jgi:hypothetical protein
MVARMIRNGDQYTATGFCSVEVRVDDGSWQPATLDRANTQYSWKLFTYQWSGLKPGDHTIVSRATDVNGTIQPEQSELQSKKTRWENNGQFVRKFRI